MSVRDYFEQRAREGSWGSLYDGPAGVHNYNFLTRREAVLGLLKADGRFARVLDVGCGTGDYAEIATRHGGAYHGIDFAAGMITGARRRAASAEHAPRLLVGSGEALPYADGCFDLVLGLGYVAYFTDPRPALREIGRVLRPGGTAVLQVAKVDVVGWLERRLARAKPTLPPGWVNVRYSQGELDRLMKEAGFERVGFVFNNFSTLPGFLRRRYPSVMVRVSEALTRRRPNLWRPLAVNYIGKYVSR